MLFLWFKKDNYFKTLSRDFRGSPGVKTSPSGAGGAGSTPGQGNKVPVEAATCRQCSWSQVFFPSLAWVLVCSYQEM